MKLFLTYDDGTHSRYLDFLHKSVREYGPEWHVVDYRRTAIAPAFAQSHYEILSERRGGGYWVWKPYIIRRFLGILEKGDLLFYLDSKYYFWEPFEKLYANIQEHGGIVAWRNKPNEEKSCLFRDWCKRSVVEDFDMEEVAASDHFYDCWAGAIIIEKSDFTLELVDSWLNSSLNYDAVTDSASRVPNLETFQEHRHDQSLLTIALHKFGVTMQDDPANPGGAKPLGKRHLQSWRHPYDDCAIVKTAKGKRRYLCPPSPPSDAVMDSSGISGVRNGEPVFSPFSAHGRRLTTATCGVAGAAAAAV